MKYHDLSFCTIPAPLYVQSFIIFSCEEAALEVQMYVCVCVCVCVCVIVRKVEIHHLPFKSQP